MCAGCQPGEHPESAPLHHHLGGTFHYVFNAIADRRPIPHAAAMVDTCLTMSVSGEADGLARQVSFIYIDWIFCLHRAARQSGHRVAAAEDALRRSAALHFEFIRSLPADHAVLNDLHMLFGVVCAWAELQLALPGEVRTQRPMKNVLDRRPFI